MLQSITMPTRETAKGGGRSPTAKGSGDWRGQEAAHTHGQCRQGPAQGCAGDAHRGCPSTTLPSINGKAAKRPRMSQTMTMTSTMRMRLGSGNSARHVGRSRPATAVAACTRPRHGPGPRLIGMALTMAPACEPRQALLLPPPPAPGACIHVVPHACMEPWTTCSLFACLDDTAPG